MIRIQQLKLRPGQNEEELIVKAAKLLRVDKKDIKALHIVKRSLDARKKPELFYSYAVDVEVEKEEKVFSGCAGKQITRQQARPYVFPDTGKIPPKRPIIIGMGPAGLFCGYFLAKAGFAPLLLERGKDVDGRLKDVEAFWQDGRLNPESNVQFGEGGAGTFSDGKLNTLVKDKYGRNREVLRLLTVFGAPKEILYESKPHIGTDILKDVVKRMRKEICRLGGGVLFESQVTDICMNGNRISAVVVNGEKKIEADTVVLAIGHSARNTFEMLYKNRIPMEAKPFAVGFRVEHSQAMINESQYGREYLHCLPAASYKVAAKTADGRGVYSFCMCPGGYVVNASSEQNRLCVNGMSYSKRDGSNANSAIIVTIHPQDYGSGEPLSGLAFQRKLEEKAYLAGEGKVPVQTYASFQASVKKTGTKEADTGRTFFPAVKGRYVFADLTGILPEMLNKDIVEGMEQFAKEIKGFDRPDTLLSGVESRTSSPVRILRDDTMQSAVRGLYPCGEGAGYAGGITSAAMDGMKAAEAIVTACRAEETEGNGH